ncbi:hypothetical protein [Thermostichus vulcanus]|uniref:Uncharacterized protein n=1 Tax=Thermostichus vulcanus str. 'Rupite' TaxID=2813851 RepID=A0ABT0CCG9_THEVL|nr:hypothetical protein [Thermostichus vulcanus]MCJ2543455.1 hypothetical protein [Thermostichus vulcanus str. 'Rupite']
MQYERLINIVLRAYGQTSRHGLDQETLTLYAEGPYTLYKLTSHFDRRSIFVLAQNQRDVFVSGDAFHNKIIPGDWQVWLQQKALSIAPDQAKAG